MSEKHDRDMNCIVMTPETLSRGDGLRNAGLQSPKWKRSLNGLGNVTAWVDRVCAQVGWKQVPGWKKWLKYLGERNDLGSSWFKSKAAIEGYRALSVPWQHGCLCGFNGFRFWKKEMFEWEWIMLIRKNVIGHMIIGVDELINWGWWVSAAQCVESLYNVMILGV